jgi:hypothetical protein
MKGKLKNELTGTDFHCDRQRLLINTDNLSDEEFVEQDYECLFEHLGEIGTERFIAYT